MALCKKCHIRPVVSVEFGFIDWQVYIDRLFVEEEGYRAICKACHDKLTKEQNAERKNAAATETIWETR